jgi:hypothetical protein
MGCLGELLEVVCGPDRPPASIRATIRQWANLDLGAQAAAAGSPMGPHKPRPAGAAPRTAELTLSVWACPPSRLRIERSVTVRGVTQTHLTVVGGDRWWHCDPQGHVEIGEQGGRGAPLRSDYERHFDPAHLRQFLGDLVLQERGTVHVAGRVCVHVHAVPRPGNRIWPHWLPKGADEYEFHADPERAAVLAILARYRGEVFSADEVTEVAFGEVLDPGLFVYRPQPGEQIRPAGPVAEQLTLRAAAERVPFTILLPGPSPLLEPASLDVHYHRPRPGSQAESLTIGYLGPHSLWLTEKAAAESEDDEYEWEQVEYGGLALRISDPGGEGTRMVALQRHGTSVTIHSKLDRDALFQLAASLAPASGPAFE